jgi:hypothetical protein
MSGSFSWMNLTGTGSATGANPCTPAAPVASQVAEANKAVTVFDAGTIVNVADILNPPSASEPLYVDLVADASAGSATSIPLQPGQGYRVSAPITTAVSVVAATAGHAFVAVRY